MNGGTLMSGFGITVLLILSTTLPSCSAGDLQAPGEAHAEQQQADRSHDEGIVAPTPEMLTHMGV
ncbi:MAG: hypothetical protein ACE5ID_04660, partial [Acidobacteriota bacterium]